MAVGGNIILLFSLVVVMGQSKDYAGELNLRFDTLEPVIQERGREITSSELVGTGI